MSRYTELCTWSPADLAGRVMELEAAISNHHYDDECASCRGNAVVARTAHGGAP
jgi:hypothetical protein